MPVDEAGLHQPALALPPGLLASEEVWTIRFTGEVFRDYEYAFRVRLGYGGLPDETRVLAAPHQYCIFALCLGEFKELCFNCYKSRYWNPAENT